MRGSARRTTAPWQRRRDDRRADANVPGTGRMATAEEIAAFAVSAAAPDLTYLTGSALAVSGGTGTG